MELLPFVDILKVFNNPINEEQAWAVCYQCVHFLQRNPSQEFYQDVYDSGIHSIWLSRHGDVLLRKGPPDPNGSGKGPPLNSPSRHCHHPSPSPSPSSTRTITTPHHKGKGHVLATETDAVQSLGTAIFEALDYGIDQSEERQLSPELEAIIAAMTNTAVDTSLDYDVEAASNGDDEGIEKDADVDTRCTVQDVIKMCVRHVSSKQDASHHYKAVCRALATEAGELFTFLDKVAAGKEQLSQTEDEDARRLEELQRADWACLWVQVMRSLRQGVRLKKVEHVHLPPLEYELTPFEMILEDIRSRRYTLTKIMVNGDIPHKVKNDAHAVILNFIRSRPPLKKVDERKLKPKPPSPPDPHELLLNEIRSRPKLRPIRDGRVVVEKSDRLTSRASEESEEEVDTGPKAPAKRVIKPDFDLLLNNSFEESSDDEDRSSNNSPGTPEYRLQHHRLSIQHQHQHHQHHYQQQQQQQQYQQGSYSQQSLQQQSPHLFQRSDSLTMTPPPKHTWQRAVTREALLRDPAASGSVGSGGAQAGRPSRLQRRHTITVCESPLEHQVPAQELPVLQEEEEEPSPVRDTYSGGSGGSGGSSGSSGSGGIHHHQFLLGQGARTSHSDNDLQGCLVTSTASITLRQNPGATPGGSNPGLVRRASFDLHRRSLSAQGSAGLSSIPEQEDGQDSNQRPLTRARSQEQCPPPNPSPPCKGRAKAGLAMVGMRPSPGGPYLPHAHRAQAVGTSTTSTSSTTPPSTTTAAAVAAAAAPRANPARPQGTSTSSSTAPASMPHARSDPSLSNPPLSSSSSSSKSNTFRTAWQSQHVHNASSSFSSSSSSSPRPPFPRSLTSSSSSSSSARPSNLLPSPSSSSSSPSSGPSTPKQSPQLHRATSLDMGASSQSPSYRVTPQALAMMTTSDPGFDDHHHSSNSRWRNGMQHHHHHHQQQQQQPQQQQQQQEEEERDSSPSPSKPYPTTNNSYAYQNYNNSNNNNNNREYLHHPPSPNLGSPRRWASGTGMPEDCASPDSPQKMHYNNYYSNQQQQHQQQQQQHHEPEFVGAGYYPMGLSPEETRQKRLSLDAGMSMYYDDALRHDAMMAATTTHGLAPTGDSSLPSSPVPPHRDTPATTSSFSSPAVVRKTSVGLDRGVRGRTGFRRIKSPEEEERVSRWRALQEDDRQARLRRHLQPQPGIAEATARGGHGSPVPPPPRQVGAGHARRSGLSALAASPGTRDASPWRPEGTDVLQQRMADEEARFERWRRLEEGTGSHPLLDHLSQHHDCASPRLGRARHSHSHPYSHPHSHSHPREGGEPSSHLYQDPGPAAASATPPPPSLTPAPAYPHPPPPAPSTSPDPHSVHEVLPLPKRWQNPVECLSLTLEEVTHIRSVLTKAELESLISHPDLYQQVAKNKLCFTCKTTRFALFGEWGTKCKFCKRTVCSKCLRKMNVPADHFRNIPVYTLSPMPLSPDMLDFIQDFIKGAPAPSVPATREHSPVRQDALRPPLPSSSSSATASSLATPSSSSSSSPQSVEAAGKAGFLSGPGKVLQRSQSAMVTTSQKGGKSASSSSSTTTSSSSLSGALKGPMMAICCDCKGMVMEIIRATRASLTMLYSQEGRASLASPSSPAGAAVMEGGGAPQQSTFSPALTTLNNSARQYLASKSKLVSN